jgi:hypothetical protein
VWLVGTGLAAPPDPDPDALVLDELLLHATSPAATTAAATPIMVLARHLLVMAGGS